MVQRGYQLPAFVQGPETLVIGVSYSGNTEETLSAFNQAHARGALLTALTTGGEMLRLANAWHVPVLRFDYPAQPRAALGYSFVPLLNLLSQLGLVTGQANALQEAIDVMRAWQKEIGPEVPTSDNPAKQLADALRDRVPVVYGAGLLQPVARRWKTQFNENAKVWSFFEALPELNHNAVVGFERSAQIREQAAVITLRSRDDSARIQRRWRVTGELLSREKVAQYVVEARGASRLAQMLSAIHFGDLVSVYLALVNDMDPTPVAPINYLKAQLADR
jgi:glucose/mannose-6-phosphate isomerase